MPDFTHIEVESDSLPVIELDTEAQSDLDSDGNILGLELIGVKDFTVSWLLQKAHLENAVPAKILERTRDLAAA
jgi:hypothetical protein